MAAASPVDPGLERSFRGHKDAISSVCFNPNMKQLISGGHDGCVMVWNVRSAGLGLLLFAGRPAQR